MLCIFRGSLTLFISLFHAQFFHDDLASQIYGFGSIDLKSMHAENLSDVVPPSSRSTNYIVLRFCDFPSETTVRLLRKNLFINLVKVITILILLTFLYF